MSLKKIFNCVAAIGLLSFAVHAAAVSVGEGDWDFCSKEKPCKKGQGDCDSDDECKDDLIKLKCTKTADVGPKYGFDKGVDVCEPITDGNATVNNATNNGNGGNATVNNSTNNGNGGNATVNNANKGTSYGNNLLSNGGTGGNASVGTCRVEPGSERYCADCGPCGEKQGLCFKNSHCATDLVCKNYYCVKP